MKMENVRIAVLSSHDKVCTFLDNDASGAMHYYDDELHEYLKGTANTCTFKSDAKHEDSIHLIEGNKLSFRYKKKDYYLNIMSVRRDEYVVEVTAYSLNFELLNEQKGPYKAANAMSFAQYMDVFDYEKVVTLGINEVSSKSIKNEWTGTETMLARLFSLSNIFDAEIELIPQLNDDYSLKEITLNVYQAHTDTVQGVGTDRTDMVLRFGKNISGVTKTSNVTELYTLVYPFGKEGLTVASLDKTEYDAEGRIEYRSPAGDRNIYAVIARDRFPSNATSPVNNRYIAQQWNYDTDNVNVLYSQALAQLKKNCVPQVKYEVEGYFDTSIGDTVTIADDEFNPPLYLQARVTEQTRSFTDPSRNKTTFDNFKELQNEIDPSLLSAVSALIEANKTYTCSIISNNGIIFKNGEGSTTLTASVRDGGKDMTDNITINWTRDGAYIYTGKSFSILASDISGKSVYRFEAIDSGGTIRGTYEVTVSNISDGESGTDGVSPTVTVNPDTSLTITDKNGTQITPILKGAIGSPGAKGDPTGITVSATEPVTKYAGMLWQYTGTADGLIKNATYRWTGSAWTLHKFRSENIEADSLAAISANLGTVNAGKINGVEISGSVINGSSRIMLFKKDSYGNDIFVTTDEYGLTIFRLNAITGRRDANVNISPYNISVGVSRTFNDMNSAIDNLLSRISPVETKLNTLCSSVVTKGRVNVTAGSTNWLNVTGIPGYNANNRYYAIVNNSTVPLSAFVRNDGRLIAWGPNVSSGTTYTVDYLVFIS
jgi:phage minor structural protein